MSELFTIPETPSPRLAWMRKHGVETHKTEHYIPGDEDEFGNAIHRWYACRGELNTKTACGGATEQEALCEFAKFHGLRLWNEE